MNAYPPSDLSVRWQDGLWGFQKDSAGRILGQDSAGRILGQPARGGVVLVTVCDPSRPGHLAQ